MGVAAGGCMRMLGFIMTIVIVLSVFAVSYENDFWNFWGEEKAAAKSEAAPLVPKERVEPDAGSPVKGFALAIPVPTKPAGEEGADQDGAEKNQQLEEVPELAQEAPQEAARDEIVGEGVTSNMLGEPEEEQEAQESAPVPFEQGSPGETSSVIEQQLLSPVPPAQTHEEAKLVKNEAKQAPTEAPTQEPTEAQTQPPISGPKKEPGTGGQQGPKEEQKPYVQMVVDEHDAGNEGDEIEEGKKMETEKNSSAGSEDTSIPKRRSRAKSFLVVFMGHSGSTAFTTELRTHTEFDVELLEPLDHGVYNGNTDLALKRARELMDKGIAKGKIPGFKVRPFHIQNKREAWRKFVKEYDTRVFWQYRENIVKQAVGEYRHRFLNDSSVVEGLGRKEKPCAGANKQKCRIKIENMRGLHALMNDFSGSDELLSNAVRSLRRDGDISIVRYEDYLYKRERTMRETFNFLGVDYQDTAPQRLKASPDSLCEMVINFQDVCDYFLPCQLWRPFLHDDVNNCRCKPGSWKTFDATYCKRSAWYQARD